MIKEIAIDPDFFSKDLDILINTINQFGFHKGRLISLFPKSWKRDVIEHIRKFPDGRKKETLKNNIENRENLIFSKSGRTYSPRIDWFGNVSISQKEQPFDAIIRLCNKNYDNVVCDGDIVDFESPPLSVNTDAYVNRDPTSITQYISKLLSVSNYVRFIDPYFNPEEINSRWLKVFKASLKYIKNHNVLLEYHFKESNNYDRRPPWSEYKDNSNKWFRNVLPENFELHLYCWDEKKPIGEVFHDRFLISEYGAYKFSVGLDAGNKGQTTQIANQSVKCRKEMWNRFNDDSDVYELIGKATVGHDGNVVT
jgi:hypothetical protein